MNDREIVAYAKTTLEPIRYAYYGGAAYRCAAYLSDGLYVPCVVIASRASVTDLAVRRFEETRSSGSLLSGRNRPGKGMRYRDIVSSFVSSGNCVNSYDIERLEKSRSAIPLGRDREIQGETSMGWTQFTGVMKDSREFSFGTAFHTEFFQMPEGYSGEDVVRILSHQRGEGPVYRERPFFTCYVDGL